MAYTFGSTPVGNLGGKKKTKKPKTTSGYTFGSTPVGNLGGKKVRADGTVKDDKPKSYTKNKTGSSAGSKSSGMSKAKGKALLSQIAPTISGSSGDYSDLDTFRNYNFSGSPYTFEDFKAAAEAAGYGKKDKASSDANIASGAGANTFRANEEKMLTKSSGTAGSYTPPPTAKQKEDFRKQEEKYLTNYSGTAGDKYYKNPQGTGTGQGGSGIPVSSTSTESTKTKKVTSSTPTPSTPTYTPPSDTVDMSSSGDDNKRTSASATPTASYGSGGQATDIEDLPPEAVKLRSAIRRRRARRQGKRGLRQTASLNIPTSGSGLSIPT